MFPFAESSGVEQLFRLIKKKNQGRVDLKVIFANLFLGGGAKRLLLFKKILK